VPGTNGPAYFIPLFSDKEKGLLHLHLDGWLAYGFGTPLGAGPGVNVIKLFCPRFAEFFYKARVFVPGKLFQPSLTNTLA
jgi:hypothetical protein